LWLFRHLLLRNSRLEWSIFWWKSRNYFEGISSVIGTRIASLYLMAAICHPFTLHCDECDCC
jgi:hypothetical protein